MFDLEDEPETYTRDQIACKIQWFFDCMNQRKASCAEIMDKFERITQKTDPDDMEYPDKEDYLWARSQRRLLEDYLEAYYTIFEGILTNRELE